LAKERRGLLRFLDDVRAARARLDGIIHVTPCAHSETLSAMTGARVFLKLENLQMTGSFKERGATNTLLQLGPDERRRGVVTASAGNHGLAVAFHAARLGIAAVIATGSSPTARPKLFTSSFDRSAILPPCKRNEARGGPEHGSIAYQGLAVLDHRVDAPYGCHVREWVTIHDNHICQFPRL
jgi:threonine dehydratase